jgi:ribosome-associated protein
LTRDIQLRKRIEALEALPQPQRRHLVQFLDALISAHTILRKYDGRTERYTGAEEGRARMIPINDELAIPDEEVSFATSRSGGPGGQNVNKLETRVTVRFDVVGSPSLSEEQRQRILERLATRVTRAGIFHVTSQKHRTQADNREAAVARFAELMAEALREEAPRKPTRVPKAAKRRRLDEKRRQGQRKRDRSSGIPSD